jgi:hypothetical protein
MLIDVVLYTEWVQAPLAIAAAQTQRSPGRSECIIIRPQVLYHSDKCIQHQANGYSNMADSGCKSGAGRLQI